MIELLNLSTGSRLYCLNPMDANSILFDLLKIEQKWKLHLDMATPDEQDIWNHVDALARAYRAFKQGIPVTVVVCRTFEDGDPQEQFSKVQDLLLDFPSKIHFIRDDPKGVVITVKSRERR